MSELSEYCERIILVHIGFFESSNQNDLVEFKELAKACGGTIVTVITGTRGAPEPKYLIGKGKTEEIRDAVEYHKIDLAIFDHDLSPAQARNLEQVIRCRVLDRTGLILDIFAQRARTFEGKLQVELAQLQYLSTKLVRGWTHLERQKGGIGLRGPGETQLETDRRLIRNRIKNIRGRLQAVRRQRDQNRRSRRKVPVPTISIVGYTNAGKSSLFNAMTGADCWVANQLFVTLDPTMRKVTLPSAGVAVLADTVGFIRNLPHDLIDAFHATLEETRDADVLLHVIDVSDPEWPDRVATVNHVLEEIDAANVPVIKVYNKIDLVPEMLPAVDDSQDEVRVWVSATKQQGIDLLLAAITNKLYGDFISRTLYLGPHEGKLRAELYRLGMVLHERIDDNGYWVIAVNMVQKDFERLFG